MAPSFGSVNYCLCSNLYVSIHLQVFLGGVPWDINDAMLVHAFKQFGLIRVEWPGSKQQGVPPPKGYVYIIFECEKQV